MIGLHLETSVLIAQTIKVPVLSHAVAETIDKSRTYRGLSEYAILEYHNAVIKPIDTVIKFLRKYKDTIRVRDHIDRTSRANPYRGHADIYGSVLTKVEYELRSFASRYGAPDDGFEEAMSAKAVRILEDFKRGWIRRLERLADGKIKSGTSCHWVSHLRGLRPGATIKGDIQCHKDHQRCRIVDFLQSKTNELKIIKSQIDALPLKRVNTKSLDPWQTDELRRLSQAIQNFLVNKDSAADYDKGCRCFADAIQALEMETFQALYTMNYKEFVLLCRALKQNLVWQPATGDLADLDAIMFPAPLV